MKLTLPEGRFAHSLGSLAFAAVLAVAAFVFRRDLVLWFSSPDDAPSSGSQTSSHAVGSSAAPSASSSDSAEIDHYTCPMHPSVHEKSPGKCPICGMTLVPVLARDLAQGIVTIDEARRQLIGVRTGSVVRAPFKKSFRAVGRVTYDESKLTDVTLKVRGFITKLLVSRTGQRVEKGQPLFQLYSPDLFSAEQDYLLVAQGVTTAPATAGTPPGRLELLTRAARQRLHLLGLDDAQIDAVSERGAPSESIEFPSPASGFVIEKDVVEGAAVEAGMRLYRIAKLDKVWVEADVYEADLARVRVGQAATVALDYLPGRTYDGKIAYVYPFLDPTARTGRVRIELANRELELRPGMYASVTLASDSEPRLQVPVTAVVYTGPRRLVFVDLGGGHFRPTEVRVGTEADGMYEVLAGLAEGDRVVTSGVFLVAAEARISTAAKYWENAPDPSAAMPRMSVSEPAPSAAPRAMAPPVPKAPPQKPAPAPRSPSSASPPSSAPAPAAVFTCPMHPEIRRPAQGECPICGMPLVPAKPGAIP